MEQIVLARFEIKLRFEGISYIASTPRPLSQSFVFRSINQPSPCMVLKKNATGSHEVCLEQYGKIAVAYMYITELYGAP